MSNVSGSTLMSDFNFVSKYAKYNPELKRRETFEESVDRMINMHLRKYVPLMSTDEDKVAMESAIHRAFGAVKRKEVLASQRALQFGGPGVEKHNMRMYNCAVSYCDRPKFFSEAFYMLLCGCGIGFSVQKHHVNKLPRFYEWGQHKEPGYQKKRQVFVAPDTIEGWADCLDILVKSYLEDQWEAEYEWEFDLSQIRPMGAALSTGGTAPGPEPLANALNKVRAVLDEVSMYSDRLTTLACYDIVMHASDAVLSGGVRRSATIALFSPDDEEMMNAKTGNWFIDNPQRGRSNNSAVLVKGQDNEADFRKLIKRTREFGEPGFCFVASREYIFNPCVEIGMCPVLIKDASSIVCKEYTLDMLDNPGKYKALGYTYESGWQCCNLTEMNAAIIKSRAQFKKAIDDAVFIGTLQAGFVEPGYLTDISRQIIEREALLGVSMTGMMDNPEWAFNYDLLHELAQYAIEVNKFWAKIIGINSAARVTAIKPAGNTTITLGVGGSGCHAVHAHDMLRLVQVNKFDPVYQLFKSINPHMCAESVWSANKTDDVIMFPISAPRTAIVKDDLTALEFLGKVRSLQQSWILGGTARPMSCEGLSHNVSNTCVVAQDEWDEVADYIYEHHQDFSGLSLLGKSGDFIYEQAPMQKMWFEQELVETFGSANVGAAKHIKRHLDDEFGSIRHVMAALKQVLQGEDTRQIYGATSKRVHPALDNPDQIIAQAKSDALWNAYQRIRQLIHVENVDDIILLLASIGHEEEWNRIVKDMKPVDYTQLIEEIDITKLADQIACAGGNCLI